MRHQPEFPLQRVSTAEAVADGILSLIVSGAIRAGEPLRESALTAKFGVSRNSVREAIRLLEQSRLVQHEIHRGAIVSTPTLEDLDDLYRTRLQLELAGVQQVPDEAQLRELQDAFHLLSRSSEQKLAEPIVSADLGLHQAIVDLLGSKRLSSFYQQICRELVFYFTVLSYTDHEYVNPEEAIVGHHERIYDAIVAGDRVTAATLLEEHIDGTHARLSEILAERNPT